MYQLDRRIHHHRRLRNISFAILVLALGSFGVYKLQHATVAPDATIHNSTSVNTSYSPGNGKVMHVEDSLFTLDLPVGWKEIAPITHVNVPNHTYRSSGATYQELDIFMDNIPTSLAVNRVVAVSALGAGMDHGEVSDNCTTFTPPSAGVAGSGVASGVWQGHSFLCDTGNYERDVVGIASPDGINSVKLTGPNAGTHKVFLTYIDNSINPDFSILYSILSSFKLK